MYAAPAAPKKPDLSNIKGDFETTASILDVDFFFQSNSYILRILAHFFFANIGRCAVVYKVAAYVIYL